MSNTIVDFPKVCQMLDNGWRIELFRNDLGTYTAQGQHENRGVVERARDKFLELVHEDHRDAVAEDWDDGVTTDDFTPEQALTRLAYKVGGCCL